MSETTNPSMDVLKEVRSGRHVKMHYSRDGPLDTIIQLSPAPEHPKAIVKEQRIRDGEVTAERFIGQPRIDTLIENRSWWSANDPEVEQSAE
jgi:anaerobic glycerol-3-phosphate dehydrogenase